MVRVNVNSGNGDIYWPSAATAMIGEIPVQGVQKLIVVIFMVLGLDHPNFNGVIALNGSVAQTLTINARDLIAPTVSGANLRHCCKFRDCSISLY